MTETTIDIQVIYQDHHLLIVNKPAGLVIHPTYKHADGTMWDSILAYLAQQGGDDWQPEELPDRPQWAGAPETIRVMLREQQRTKQWQEEGLLPRPCLLHRIDKDTSGIVTLARTERARRSLIRQFYDHSIVKRYLAVARRGSPEWTRPRAPFHIFMQNANDEQLQPVASAELKVYGATYLLNGPLQRDPADRRRCIVGSDGQSAETLVRVIATQGEYTLLEARPITGRTHQIRAHLAAAGYAIVGDSIYGLPADERTAAVQLHRQFLHASSLELRDYPDNRRRTFVAPLAADLVMWLAENLPEGLEILNAGKAVRG